MLDILKEVSKAGGEILTDPSWGEEWIAICHSDLKKFTTAVITYTQLECEFTYNVLPSFVANPSPDWWGCIYLRESLWDINVSCDEDKYTPLEKNTFSVWAYPIITGETQYQSGIQLADAEAYIQA